ncbi:hypothetical protein RHGRI_002018 [Rhododendron griersonianum]|uniref:Uncharacterized protein n=1 Tax=Rhododendron griersonianum TaxID=479676 RepID=A0AAV6LM76_9ERIC|nr:hypothetical protein RHGRI_002018 [Rhododendron griersonianum]
MISFFLLTRRFRGLYSLEVRLYSPLGWDCFQIDAPLFDVVFVSSGEGIVIKVLVLLVLVGFWFLFYDLLKPGVWTSGFGIIGFWRRNDISAY